MTAENILTLLGINGGVFVAVFFILRWLLQRTIEAKIDVMKAKEIEAFKVELSKELESAKHRLELEHTRTAIIYENQRSSFSNIIKAMHGAIRVIELSYNSGTETWEPIEERDLENFRKLVMEESLFVGKECESVLNLRRRHGVKSLSLTLLKTSGVIHKKVGPAIYFEFPPIILPYLQFFNFQRQVLVIN